MDDNHIFRAILDVFIDGLYILNIYPQLLESVTSLGHRQHSPTFFRGNISWRHDDGKC